jgi:hypothetical protein
VGSPLRRWEPHCNQTETRNLLDYHAQGLTISGNPAGSSPNRGGVAWLVGSNPLSRNQTLIPQWLKPARVHII